MEEQNKTEAAAMDTVATPAVEKLAPEDIQALERANVKRQLAVSEAEKAVAQSETADLQYKNVVMQLFIKYGLTARDSITPDGTINRAKDGE